MDDITASSDAVNALASAVIAGTNVATTAEDLIQIKKEIKKNFKLCEDLKKCEANCSCNKEADCDICRVIDFTLKKERL